MNRPLPRAFTPSLAAFVSISSLWSGPAQGANHETSELPRAAREEAAHALAQTAPPSAVEASRAAGDPSKESTESSRNCSGERIAQLTRDLDGWIRQYSEAERQLAARLRCDEARVICLDRFGQLNSDSLPDRVRAGSDLSVFVLLPSADTGRVSIETSYRSHAGQAMGPSEGRKFKPPAAGTAGETLCGLSTAERDAVRKSAMPIARLASRPGLESLGVPPDSFTDLYWSPRTDGRIVEEWTAWIEAQRGQATTTFTSMGSRLQVPSGDLVNIDFMRFEQGTTVASVERHYELSLDNGKYYLELALLLPFVYRGDRAARLVPAEGTNDLRLGIDEDWHVTAAATIQYFPLGRQRGQTVSFRNCRWASCIENWLGAQFGLGFSRPFEEWYLGIVLQPVSGFSVGLGASLLRGEFLARGRSEGMLIPSRTGDLAHERYMFRPYLGFSLTLDIVDTLERAYAGARNRL